MKFCNGVDENFQHPFIMNISYRITEACNMNTGSTGITVPYKTVKVFITTIISFMTKYSSVNFFHEHRCKASCKKIEIGWCISASDFISNLFKISSFF